MNEICGEKKFIDLQNNIYIIEKNNIIESISDNDNNLWIREDKSEEGGYGMVRYYKSMNNEYSDIIIKSIEKKSELDYEIKLVSIFSSHPCRNFLKSDILETEKDKYIVMEKIDGDLFDFSVNTDVDNIKNQILSEILIFISEAYICYINKGYIFSDIKRENIGFKICENKDIKFCFLDFGSFHKIGSNEEPTISYPINNIAYKNHILGDTIIFYFSFIITVILLQFQVFLGPIKADEFSSVINKLAKKKKYDSKLLKIEYYREIENTYFSYFEKNDIGEYLLKYLYVLTYKIPNLKQHIKFVRNIY
jgi:hypothetical protein